MQPDCGSDTLFVVYTGDVGPGKATKEQVLAKAEVSPIENCEVDLSVPHPG